MLKLVLYSNIISNKFLLKRNFMHSFPEITLTLHIGSQHVRQSVIVLFLFVLQYILIFSSPYAKGIAIVCV